MRIWDSLITQSKHYLTWNHLAFPPGSVLTFRIIVFTQLLIHGIFYSIRRLKVTHKKNTARAWILPLYFQYFYMPIANAHVLVFAAKCITRRTIRYNLNWRYHGYYIRILWYQLSIPRMKLKNALLRIGAEQSLLSRTSGSPNILSFFSVKSDWFSENIIVRNFTVFSSVYSVHRGDKLIITLSIVSNH